MGRLKGYLLPSMSDGPVSVSLPEESELIGLQPVGRPGAVSKLAVVVYVPDENVPLVSVDLILGTVDNDMVTAEFDLPEDMELVGHCTYQLQGPSTAPYVTSYLFG